MRTLLVKPAEPENITFRDMSRWAVGVVLVPLIVILLVLFVCFGCATVDKGATTSQKVEPVSTWRAVAFSAAALDLGTTFAGQRSGAREQNPILGQGRGRILALNVVLLSVVWLASRELEPEEQVKLWRWVAALHLGAAAWNVHELKR